MKIPSIDDLVLLPEPLALQRHFDAKSWKVFRWLLLLTVIVCLIGIGATIAERQWPGLAIHLVMLALTLAVFATRKEEWFERLFRQVLLGFLSFQLVIWKPLGFGESKDQEAVVLDPFLFLFLRLRPAETLALYGTHWVLETFTFDPRKSGWIGADFDPRQTIVTLVLMTASLAWTRFERRRFLGQFRRESLKSRERLRMREEVGYARKIQLSMLPQQPPAVDWLELAAVSLPATEVGGDYYDSFVLAPERTVLVVGDVSGHGLASGLLLSGVRSCLYLLEEDLAAPVAVLEKLSPMVRSTTGKRMYMTLLLAVLDHAAGTLTVASAGHVPLLRRDATTGTWEEVGKGAPPLGTFEGARFETDVRPLAAGDLLFLFSDGLLETRNAAGREYGRERLEEALGRVGRDKVVEAIRDAILADLAAFRGRTEQEDDVTLVVARVCR